MKDKDFIFIGASEGGNPLDEKAQVALGAEFPVGAKISVNFGSDGVYGGVVQGIFEVIDRIEKPREKLVYKTFFSYDGETCLIRPSEIEGRIGGGGGGWLKGCKLSEEDTKLL
jgi:hypothetical protein